MRNEIRKEVIGIILLALGIISALLLYLPQDITGILGSLVNKTIFGLVGTCAVVVPFFLLYASIDYFVERRTNVARIRVRSLMLILVLVSALLAVITTDFDYFKELCVKDGTDKASAWKSLLLLWNSGANPSLIQNTTITMGVIPGGLIGGIIATSLYVLCGRTVSIITLICITIAIIVMVFHISIKNTAKQIAGTTKKAIMNVQVKRDEQLRRKKEQEAYKMQYIKQHPNSPEAIAYRQNLARSNARKASAPNQTYNFTDNQPTGYTDVNNLNVEYDPFKTSAVPVTDTGFIDVNRAVLNNDKTIEEQYPDDGPSMFDHDLSNPTDNQVKEANRANELKASGYNPTYDYSTTPLSPPPVTKKTNKVPSFLQEEKEEDFFDFAAFGTPIEEESTSSITSAEEDDVGEPILIEDSNEYVNPNQIRTPNIDVSSIPENSNVFVTPQVLSDPIASTASTIDSSTNTSSNLDRDASNIKINDTYMMDQFKEESRHIDMSNTAISKENNIEYSIPEEPKKVRHNIVYRPVPTRLLAPDKNKSNPNNDAELRSKALDLEKALASFGISAKVINITHGPSITRFEITLAPGIKVSKVQGLSDDIQLAMAATSVRIEAPIPGTSAIGIEIPNKKISPVHLRSILETDDFKTSAPLVVALGRDIPGRPILCDLSKMPHLLVAGATGSGKSVCINTILTSILCKSTPDQVRIIMIDPKMVELSVYNGIPHLYLPVVTNPKKAANALRWAVTEMEKRYMLFAEAKVRDLNGYNEYMKLNGENPIPQVLIVIDELADLMTVAAKEVEEHISRLAAMARAAGMHMILATQRPSVDVITGVIKSNIPSRIAFAVSSGVDSKTILDTVGAEKLLGKGDMLYSPTSAPKPIRCQGAFLSDEEVSEVTSYLKKNFGPNYDESIVAQIESNVDSGSSSGDGGHGNNGGVDDSDKQIFEEAVDIILQQKAASVSILQRRLGIGYPRAARLIDMMEQKHIIGPFEGSKPRKVLITPEHWLEMKAKGIE